MPYFTRQVAPDGSLMVAAFVGVSQARRQALTQAGQPVPNNVQIQAMVDTGASCTCIDPVVLTQLALAPTGIVQISTASTGESPIAADQYDVSITIPCAPGHPPLAHVTIPVIGSQLAFQGFHALIGRDVLSGCLLTYDGLT